MNKNNILGPKLDAGIEMMSKNSHGVCSHGPYRTQKKRFNN